MKQAMQSKNTSGKKIRMFVTYVAFGFETPGGIDSQKYQWVAH
jgi:hypothetical protein